MSTRLIVRPPGPESRFGKQWRWDPRKRRLENAIHGAAIQIIDAVNVSTGEVAYEGIAIESRRGELHIVIRQSDGHLGFVFHRRFSVIPPEISAVAFARDPSQILGVLKYGSGIEEYEAVHGLALTPLEKVLEEMRLKVVEAASIGFVHALPALSGAAHELFATLVGLGSSGSHPEPNEEIDHVRFFPPEEVRKIKTICSLTQAALWRFRCWGLIQSPDSIWYQTASQL
ncbi:MAG: hypothetical protein HY093_04260 [Candidatus Liptonbacteria bacterium]|nr:hypothetical protein [Candidatus Liptonbacteria bacterium]